MMKWINKARKELTNYSDETKLWIVLMTAIVMLVSLSSCSTIEVQDTRDMEEFEKHYKSCDQWVTVSSEAWMECMMERPEKTTVVPTTEIHTTTSGNTATNTYQPITIWSSVGS
jgi:hypothetical protein